MAIDGADETSAGGDRVEAEEPVEPDEPVEHEEPVEPDEADDPVEPAESDTEPTEALEPTGPVDPAEPAGVPATSGACPICGAVFDDLTSYSSHLADEHDLHDDDGAESSFGTVLVAAPALPAAAAMRSDLLEGPPPRPAGPGDRGRPWGLIVLVLGLALVLAGLLAFGPRPGGDDEVAQVGDEGTTTTEASASAGTPSTAPTTSGGGGTRTTAPPKGGDGTSTTSAPSPPTTVTSSGGGAVAPRPTTTTTVPSTTSTTKPPATFAAPATSGARIDGCQRVKNRWRVTYSWRFDGGTGWRVPAGYSPTGGGRYQDVVEVPRAGTTLIALVQVLDQANRSHDVALRPVLSSDAC